jgi:CheY-like chemotaxis protein
MRAHPDLARIPAVALSAHERLRRQALDMDFVGALLKPCSVGQLLSLMRQHCHAATSRAKPA